MKISSLFLEITFLLVILENVNSLSSIKNEDGDPKNHREKRLVRFPYNSCFALAIVVAIPLGLKRHSVYLSFNFETNYYLPYFDSVQGLVPIPFTTIDEPGVNSGTVIENADPDRPYTRQLNGDAKEAGANDTDTSDLVAEKPNTTNSINETLILPAKIISSKIKPVQSPKASKSPNKKNSTTAKNNKAKHTKTKLTAKAAKSTTKTAKAKIVKATKQADRKTSETKQAESASQENSTEKKIIRANREIVHTFLSRKKFYKTFIDKSDRNGLNGQECLLRAICEASEQPFGDHNGVLGDIVHIMFTPSSSKDEKLPLKFYQAEFDGNSGSCEQYKTRCPVGLFDFISVMK